ncbi:MAG: hypothetical protein FWC27_02220 [Firmicutes bacterium]|nr:hypothetical protein [Bacillota bacterium]
MSHDNDPATNRHADHVLQCLQYGRDNAIVGRDLRAKTGLPDRVLRKTLEGIRRGGQVVISDTVGYYLPGSLEEVQGYIRQEEARARSTFFTLQSARQLEAKMKYPGEQLTWGGGEM